MLAAGLMRRAGSMITIIVARQGTPRRTAGRALSRPAVPLRFPVTPIE
jgi:hypothetical protein